MCRESGREREEKYCMIANFNTIASHFCFSVNKSIMSEILEICIDSTEK